MKSKKGISMIVLVIIIVVVIILTAAVILSISGNNPINNAKVANLDQTKDEGSSGNRDKDENILNGSAKEEDSSDDSDKDDNTSNGSAKEVADNVSEYYGKTVTNYTANGVSDWKIFHSDGTNIYLISSGYLPIDKIPATKGGSSIVNTNSSYPKAAPLTPAVNDSNYSSGSDSISSNNPARKWLKSYLDSYSSSNSNMKAVAYMLDTDVWNVYKTDKAEYAIGGPTVEMLMESYSKKMGVDYQAKATSATGYQISKDGGANWASSYSRMLSTSETLYVLNSSSGALAMWLASPSANNIGNVMDVDSNLGYVDYNVCSTSTIGFRPVVCLKSNVKIEKNDDGNITLK